MFPAYVAKHFIVPVSDHCAILANTEVEKAIELKDIGDVFQAQASRRRRRNIIRGYRMIFQSQRTSHFEENLEAVEPRVSNEINNLFLADFEIRIPIKQMHPFKIFGIF